MDLVELVKLIGLPAALLVFFVIQGDRREKRQDLKYSSIEKFCRDELLSTSKDSIATAENSTNALEKSSEVIGHNTKVLEDIEPLIKDYLAGRS